MTGEGPNDQDEYSVADRAAALQLLRQHVTRRYRPRLAMFLIMTAVLGGIFLASKILLHYGMVVMWQRYMAADAAGYILFLLLLWLWTHVEAKLDDWADVPDVTDFNGTHSTALPTTAEPGLFDGLGVIDSLEGVICGLLLLIVALTIGALVMYNVWAAPEFLAELMLDAGLAGLLTKRLARIPPEGWFGAALRLTLPPFAIFTVITAGAAFVLCLGAPQATTLMEAVHFIAAKNHAVK